MLPKVLLERLIQSYQDFTQTVIEFETAYLRVINWQIYGFVESVNAKVENLTAWAATNFARALASKFFFQLISAFLKNRDIDSKRAGENKGLELKEAELQKKFETQKSL